MNLGWQVRSQTDTTAALEDRSPFGWLRFALSLVFLWGLGGALYVLFWLLTSREHVFLRLENDGVVASGDTWLVQKQIEDQEAGRLVTIDIKRRGFLQVMWPSLLATLVFVGLWFVLLSLIFN